MVVEDAVGERALERLCARLLYQHARAANRTTRQQLRAAVRSFVRRHRRDHT